MIHLREIKIDPRFKKTEEYPFNIPVLQEMMKQTFTTPVTLFVGENGSGKSTLLEAIAGAVDSITIGSESVARDTTMTAIRPLVESLRLVWNHRTHRGFFLRAEDFFGYVKQQRSLKASLAEDIQQIDREFSGRSDYAKSLAKGPSAGSLSELNRTYGKDLDAHSHGESFLTLFQARFVTGGLYLLDEPEAALSPISQLGLISMVQEMVEQEAQFIIATHSPILMAIPDASILNFDHTPPIVVRYDELESVLLYKDFLRDPKAYLHHL